MNARLSRPISVRRLHKEETVDIEATAEERETIAEALDLLTLDRLVARLTLKPWRSEGVSVAGTVEGDVTQACVVTLEPVPAVVKEDIHVRLHPDAGPVSVTVDVDPDEPDPPELLDSDTVDVGAIALEHFVLGLPTYPRAPGVAFEAPEPEEEEPSPFAVLASLKNNKS